MTEFKVRLLEKSDISRVVEIHHSSLPEDFLPSLGKSFLAKVFYSALLVSQNAKTFVAYHGKSVVGFVVISLNSSRLLQEIVFFRFFLFLSLLIKSVFFSRNQIKMIFGILRSSFYSNNENDLGEIYIIAVDQDYRGFGIGKKLVNNSIEFLKMQKISGIKIKTLKTNTLWISFFNRSNWKTSSEFRIADKEYVVLSNIF